MRDLIEKIGKTLGEESNIGEQKLKKIIDAMITAPKLRPLLKDLKDVESFEIQIADALTPVVTRILRRAGLNVSSSISRKADRAIRKMAKEDIE